MKKRFILFGTWLIVQPTFFVWSFLEQEKSDSQDTALPAVVEYEDNQVRIVKANRKKKTNFPDKKVPDIGSLEMLLAKMENEPTSSGDPPKTTSLGKKMSYLAKTILFTG
ncbi:hypothetical protein [Enterococcus malodoratus]|uniref:Uncharacterized protein n=1 Tax=Enterococcus malodoratus ATCC 43197 TaxID=1158601 RepID=R2NPD2_9ENTE|nr:hypothetical protein [Enterococcus malodoratus]EOH73872.1 hypothetical protein UAI_03548 [Enterococcus malodoratus ATCC 43197]EOT67210.1 hypothetical protein I585_02731 [Enterococcus malodoratus ATCC 43197]OJG59408.1 hypothetical protein RV07_GL002662 [Enterococcus malodoratus]SET54447.1 hypothetical protein SAMN04487821_11492 [Enterococcus malodoratus]SPW90912.1 Uncharacterised protein [Enterococcus malodoratus]